jgi:hypothetical protein
MATKPKRTSSKPTAAQAKEEIATWADMLSEVRTEFGFDLSKPAGFSEYLLANYGKGSDPSLAAAISPDRVIMSLASGVMDYTVAYRTVFKAWLHAFAPDGLAAARGLHSVGFLPSDDISETVFGGHEGVYASYSMNVPIAVSWFATKALKRQYPSITPLWARAVAGVAPELVDVYGPRCKQLIGVQVRGDASQRGALAWDSLPKLVKDVIVATQAGVVIVGHLDPEDLKSWGGDSESGDTLEAEVHVKRCEPGCVQHVFVASTYKLGKGVSDARRATYALDEHIEVTGRRDLYGAPKLRLHPSLDVPGGKRVVNLPKGWDWYEVPV